MSSLTTLSDRHTREVIGRLIDRGDEIGMQVAAYLGERQVLDVAMGATAEGGDAPVTPNCLFLVFSVMKGVTSLAAHVLADRGLLDLDAPIANLWPEFASHGKSGITMHDVLTHRAGIPQMPEGVTPERICDWAWMTRGIADLAPIPLAEGTTAYLAMTFGWIVGEVVRRADPAHRSIGRFVREEISDRLGIEDLHYALPPAARQRLATHSIVPDPLPPADSLNARALPHNVRLIPEIFAREDVLQAEIPAVGGVASAGALARLFAMLANGGELDGVRILSRERTRGLLEPLSAAEEYEPVLMRNWRLSTGGFLLASSNKPAAGTGPGVVFSMGMGGAIAWADLDQRVSVAICHNRMLNARSPETDPVLQVANAVRADLGLA